MDPRTPYASSFRGARARRRPVTPPSVGSPTGATDSTTVAQRPPGPVAPPMPPSPMPTVGPPVGVPGSAGAQASALRGRMDGATETVGGAPHPAAPAPAAAPVSPLFPGGPTAEALARIGGLPTPAPAAAPVAVPVGATGAAAQSDALRQPQPANVWSGLPKPAQDELQAGYGKGGFEGVMKAAGPDWSGIQDETKKKLLEGARGTL